MDGSNNSTLPCLMYETFGDCKYAINCRRSHNVSSNPTQKEIGTVVFKTNDIPGVVEFHAGAEKSKSTKYYIAKDPWFTAKAGSGDYVELTISEKKFQDTDFHHARVTKILESASVSRNRPDIGLRSFHRQKHWPLCKEFMTYSSCESGTRCNHRHDVDTAYEQSFYIAKITSVLPVRYNSYEIDVERREHGSLIISRKYRIPERDRNVSEGNLVILQESSQIYQRRRSSDIYYGKIAAVLHNSQKLEENDIPLEKKMKHGFMFRIPESQGSSARVRKIVSAYSIESCTNHDLCKRIGIHIRASSLGAHFIKLNKYFVPFYRSKGSHRASGFNIDSIRFALSIYAHSACSSVEGPSLTPLVIRPGYCYTVTDASKYQSYLKEMWEVFVKDSFFDVVVNSLASNDIATNPETWRERIVMRQTTDFFNKEIVKFLRSKSEKFVIARNVSPKLGISSKDMVISAENLRMVETNWQSPHTVEEREKTLGFFLGLAKRTEEEYWDEMLADRYIWEVLSCDSLNEGHSVIATSPIGQVVDFVNQQTVLSLMVSPHSTLYTRNDILGILVRRYHTPVILKSVVRYLSKRLLEVQFSGIFGRRRGNPVCTHKEIFPGSILSCLDSHESQRDSEDLQVVDDDDKPIENLSLILEGLSCEEYSNSKLVCLSGEKMAQLAQTSIKYGVEAGETAGEIRELIATKTEYDSPYKLHERGTIVTLSRGVELQLQVSMEGDDMEFDHWLRLLRVGKDCHLCLIHLNTPDRAFLSGRRDVKEVMLKNATEIIDKKVGSNSLKTMTLKKMDIKWSDAYFSGGTFISTVPIKPQSLLCIRKEIIAADMNTLFVWTCHAVVSEVRENEVTFLTCSVFQDQTANMWENDDNGHFIIEILYVEDKPASQSASS